MRERVIREHNTMCSQSLTRSTALKQDILIKWGSDVWCSQRHRGVVLGEQSTINTTCSELERDTRANRDLAVPTISLMQWTQQTPLSFRDEKLDPSNQKKNKYSVLSQLFLLHSLEIKWNGNGDVHFSLSLLDSFRWEQYKRLNKNIFIKLKQINKYILFLFLLNTWFNEVALVFKLKNFQQPPTPSKSFDGIKERHLIQHVFIKIYKIFCIFCDTDNPTVQPYVHYI